MLLDLIIYKSKLYKPHQQNILESLLEVYAK